MALGASIIANGQANDLMEVGVIQHIEVHERLGETTYFSLHFSCDIADGDITLLSDERLGPGADLAIVVMNADQPECLVKGPVYGQEITLANGGDGSTLVVKGADSSLTMDREFKSVIHQGTDSATVSQIVGGFGFIPDVASTTASHTEDKHTLVQRSTDLQFVRMLARRNGFKFWLSADALGMETAHFKRPSLSGSAAAELIINRQDFNINELTIQWDAHRPSSATGLQLDMATKQDITGNVATTPEEPMGSTPLLSFASDPVSVQLAAPLDDAGDFTARLEATVIDASFFVQAKCKTSAHQLGKVIRAAQVVTVTGAGSQHSGSYLVASVHHKIDETAHVMEVELIRNAVGPSA